MALAACGSRATVELPTSRLAKISLDGSNFPGDELNVKISPTDREGSETFSLAAQETIDKTFKPGEYRIELEVIKGSELILSSNYCSLSLQDTELHKLLPGDNKVRVTVCEQDSEPVELPPEPEDASIEIGVDINESLSADFFVDPYSTAMSAYKNAVANNNAEGIEAAGYIARQPSFIWISQDWLPGATKIKESISEKKSQAQGKTMGLVLYDLPNRDCGQYSAGGAANSDEYMNTVQQIIDGLDGHPAYVIVEPDALGLSTRAECAEALSLIAGAVSKLKSQGNIKVYIDAAHSNWLSPEQAADLLKRANINEADGFAVNTSNYETTEANHQYGLAIASQVGGKGFLIDTSRNGRGAYEGEEAWCNPPGRALGLAPTTSPSLAGVDAIVWAKIPGESDGTCRGGLGAGQFMMSKAVEYYNNAKDDGLIN